MIVHLMCMRQKEVDRKIDILSSEGKKCILQLCQNWKVPHVLTLMRLVLHDAVYPEAHGLYPNEGNTFCEVALSRCSWQQSIWARFKSGWGCHKGHSSYSFYLRWTGILTDCPLEVKEQRCPFGFLLTFLWKPSSRVCLTSQSQV